MKIANFSFVPFEKKLAANCSVMKNEKPLECSIFELEKDERAEYLEKLSKSKNWLTNCFLDLALFRCHFYNKPFNLFVLEDDESCLGFVEVQDDKNTKSINLLEVSNPNSFSFNKEGRSLKYIGQDLMAFVAAKAKEEKIKKIIIPQPSKYALDFYQKACAFKKDGSKNALYLDVADFDKLIELNQKNTGKKIEIIG